ncbi:MAG: diguanylate cyclase [Burkholderiales bacterium]|nr:diguanylate cyclase [Burkholderiales bacterium]
MPQRNNILIVDSRPEEVEALAAALGRDGRVTVVADSAAAWLVLLSRRPELVLIDVDQAHGRHEAQPGGYELARRIRDERSLAGVPVVLLSARLDPQAESLGLQLGAVDVLGKPLQVEIARLRVAGHLERGRLSAALVRSLRAGGLALWECVAGVCRITDGASELLGIDDPHLRHQGLHWHQLVHPHDLPALDLALRRVGLPGVGLEQQPVTPTDVARRRQGEPSGVLSAVANGPHPPAGLPTTIDARRPGGLLALDLRLRRQDGSWIWVAMHGRVIEPGTGATGHTFTSPTNQSGPSGQAIHTLHTSGTSRASSALDTSNPADATHPADLTGSSLAGTMVDISTRKQLEATLREREAGLSVLLASLHDLVITLDGEGGVSTCHLPVEFELDLPEPLTLGRPYRELLPPGIAGPLHDALAGLALDGRRRSFECSWPAPAPQGAAAPDRLRHGLASLSLLQSPLQRVGGAAGDAGEVPAPSQEGGRLEVDALALAAWPVEPGWGRPAAPGLGALLVLRDVTEHKIEEEAIRQLAYFDPLTALPNRRLLQDRLHQAQASSQRRRRHGALIFIDLDYFKQVNDQYGHHCGDQLLVELARRLQVSVRACDTVARLGGDEFVVVLADLDAQAEVARTQLGQIAAKMLGRLTRTYEIGERRHRCTASLGAALFLGVSPDMDTLLARADAAMYRAKGAGRNALCIANDSG